MLTGDCRSTQYIGISILRLGFEACTAGCVAAAASVLLLALQSLLGAGVSISSMLSRSLA